MTALILNGNQYASIVKDEVSKALKKLPQRLGLRIIMVGNDPRSAAYVRRKQQAATEVGIDCEVVNLDSIVTTEDLQSHIAKYAVDPATTGLIVQLPLPSHIDLAKVSDSINPLQDLDCFHPENQGLLLLGRPRFIPATPLGIIELLKRAGHTVSGKKVTIVNDSTIVGRPLAAALLIPGEMGEATVTVAHKNTKDLKSVCNQADILITAVGQPGLITKDHVKPGAVVLDVGISQVAGKLVGDVDFESVKEVAGAITPVPGGVGPMTVAMLIYNMLLAYRFQKETEIA